ncbi:membrane protein [Microbacterium phage FuzzBuster]|uniref:Membrane protein n=1 Tax=Microbacterium phage FuzzBuster TaxID=2590935 RepID=A0A516KV27_9CAUD|nr:membrane protein [Microbacterium phage FuzzBuster]
MIPIDMFPLDPSDFALLLDFVLALVLLLFFAFGKPRTWTQDRLGWVIFGYALTTVAFVGLIAYAIVFGQKVAEPIRFLVGIGMAVALALKIWAVYRERRAGRLANVRQTPIERTRTMSTPTPENSGSVKTAVEIWYKGQRVLRTLLTTALTVLPLIPQVIAIVQGQWSAEWLGPVAVQAVAINSALTAIIALPTVNAWLTKIGLGSVPKSAIVMERNEQGVYVLPDPKATSNG